MRERRVWFTTLHGVRADVVNSRRVAIHRFHDCESVSCSSIDKRIGRHGFSFAGPPPRHRSGWSATRQRLGVVRGCV